MCFRMLCFGHQHLLEAKRRCKAADEAKYALADQQTESFKYIEARLFMNLTPLEMNMVSEATSPIAMSCILS